MLQIFFFRNFIKQISLKFYNYLFRYKTKIAGEAKQIRASNQDPNLVFALYNESINILNNGSVTKTLKLKYKARSFDINESLNEIYIGSHVEFYNLGYANLRL